MLSRKEALLYFAQVESQKNYSRRKLKQMAIIPTYETSVLLPNDPFVHRLKRFPERLKWYDFVFALERFQTAGGLECLTFTGGEPMLWPELDRAIAYGHEKNLVMTLVTNGLNIPKVPPHRVKINLKTYFQAPPELQKQIKNNLKHFPPKTGFHYYLSENDTLDQIRAAIALSKTTDGYIYFIPEFQTDRIRAGTFQGDFPGYHPTQKLKKRWYFAAQLMKKELQKTIKLNWAVPKTLFTQEEIKSLKAENQFCTHCDNCPVGRFLLNPDGKTIYPCSMLEIKADIGDYYSNADLWQQQFRPQKKQIRLPCGGCAGMKHLAETKGSFNI